MVNKKEVVDGWPLETGDYSVGDPQCSVAVVTLGSKMNDEIVNEGAAIAGPLHTENLGVEKVVTNKNDIVICYCQSGSRSAKACAKLKGLGYINIYNLKGGILGIKIK